MVLVLVEVVVPVMLELVRQQVAHDNRRAYNYHVYLTSTPAPTRNFTVSGASMTVDYLVIGGVSLEVHTSLLEQSQVNLDKILNLLSLVNHLETTAAGGGGGNSYYENGAPGSPRGSGDPAAWWWH